MDVNNKIIGLASDHAGFQLKQFVMAYCREQGYMYKDYGTYTEESCDYPDFAHALALGMKEGEAAVGIAICGSGEGIAITLNKHQHIRARLCWMPEIAHLIRQHNDANVLCFGGRVVGAGLAHELVDAFLGNSFEGGRHKIRVDKIMAIEE